MDGWIVAFTIFLIVVVILTAIGGMLVKSRTLKKYSEPSSIGLGELDERIRTAVQEANEPLRKEIRLLREELKVLQPKQRKLDGGALQDPGLLASGGEGEEKKDRPA